MNTYDHALLLGGKLAWRELEMKPVLLEAKKLSDAEKKCVACMNHPVTLNRVLV